MNNLQSEKKQLIEDSIESHKKNIKFHQGELEENAKAIFYSAGNDEPFFERDRKLKEKIAVAEAAITLLTEELNSVV